MQGSLCVIFGGVDQNKELYFRNLGRRECRKGAEERRGRRSVRRIKKKKKRKNEEAKEEGRMRRRRYG